MAKDIEEKRAICGICPAGCWVRVGLEGGRLVSIAADEGHPLGMICRRGEHAPEIVYSPHRLRYPLVRQGPKGGYAFRRIGWDGAYDLLVRRLGEIKAASGPEAVAIYTGRGAFELSLCDVFQPAGVAVSSASSVLFPFGSPNTMGVGALCYVSFAMIAPHVTLGRMLIDLFADIENASLCVVWGANPATDSPPLDMHRLEQARRRGAEVVVVDPRRSETAQRCAAEWVPIRPGTDAALALGLIAVMLEEELHDEAFARDWTLGFAELATYVQHFRPPVVEAVTGVPEQTVRSLARRICRAAGAAPLMYTGLEYSNSGVQAIRAVLVAWALAGQLDVPGGLGLAMPGTHFPVNRRGNVANPALARAVARDRFPLYSAYRGESHASGLVDAVLHGRPYPIRALIVHGASLLTSWPQTPLWREVLSRLDFVVCIDRQLTADAAFADLVLPATTMFEIESYMTYGPIFRLRERVIAPVGEARNDYLIMAELASRLGYGALYPQSEEALLRHVLQGSGFTLEQVRVAGGTVRIPTPMMEYRKWEKGHLRDDGRPGFATPSGKLEIASTILAEHGHEPLPKYIEPSEGPLARPDLARTFPLVLDTGARVQTDFRSQHHGVPGLVRDNPVPVVELNPEDAGPRGIATGDRVEVRTLRGAVPFQARVTEDIVRGTVEANMGGGGPVGPAAWRDCNVNELTDLANRDEISGFPVYKALLCDVVRLEGGAGEALASSQSRRARAVTPGCAAPVEPAGPAGPAEPAGPVPASRHRACAVAPCKEDADGSRPSATASLRSVYLDNNATSPLDPAVREAMLPFLDARHGNPSSIHRAGRIAAEAVERARRQVAGLLGCLPRRIVFTGGGSEAINLALKGVAFAHGSSGHAGRRIVTSKVEHPAVLGACRFLERFGFPTTYLDVTRTGLVDPELLARVLDDGETLLVAVMAANNEVGTVMPVAELARLAHARGALFFTDAVQAAGRIPLDVEALGVDLLSLSAHKLHGPKGAGALYVRKGLALEPLIHGGRQEQGLRAGTENVPGIVGLGQAAELAGAALAQMPRVQALRDRLEAGIRALIPEATLNGDPEQRLPNTLNLVLPGLRGESLVIALDQHGVALSSGSACKSGSPEPSHALLALGLSAEQAHCSVRFSLSRFTSDDDVDAALAALRQVLVELETTVRFLPCK